MAHEHSPRKNPSPYQDLQLPERWENEWVHCIYCGDSTDDYPGAQYWDVPFSTYCKAHARQIRSMAKLGIVPDQAHTELKGTLIDHESTLHVCPTCGWWFALDKGVLPAIRWQLWAMTFVSTAILKDMDLADIHVPLNEARDYLARRFESRHSIHPRLFEEVVASVFKDHGYKTHVTTYANDGGIDIVLRGENGENIGVQVKRRARSVEVEQIRSFLGALTLGGYASGVFVSTMSYQRGAIKAANQSTERHIPIELVDANKFLEMLKIAQLSKDSHPDDWSNWGPPLPFRLYSHYHLNSL